MKNKVIDYVTTDDACDILGLKRSSKPQITRWIKDGRIVGAFKFGKTWAVPVLWLKSECIERGILFNGIELAINENEVKLKDYISIDEYIKGKDITYQKIYNDIIDKRIDDYVRFGTTYGVKKKDIK